MLELKLLGTARALAGGHALRFPDRKAQALLAVLALDGASTRARLAGLLWDEQGDSDARRNLRRELHRLREAGFDAWLAGDGDTLALQAEVAVDARAFVQALDGGDVRAALALYAAPLLQGFDLAGAQAFEEWLAARRGELAQRWRAAAEALAGELEAGGQPREALAVALQLLEQDTLHEAHYRRAMALHGALAEREAALALYERCRRTLGRELGLRPMAETVELADRIRSGSAAPAAAAPPVVRTERRGSAPLPALQWLPASAPLVGREAELSQLRQWLAGGGVSVLRGSAGLGKTRLLRALAAQGARGGALRLLEARAGDRQVAYASLARWLRALAVSEVTLAQWVRLELSRLLPELGAAPAPMASDAQRLRFFEAVREAWGAALARPATAALLFDDWQFVDEASAQWWSWWQQQPIDGAGIALLVAERPGEADARVAQVLRDALAAAAARVLELAPLTAAAVYALVQQLSGSNDPRRFSARLAQATGGHPFYALETLQHLLLAGVIRIDAQGQWNTPFDEGTQDYRELPIAPSVQAAVLQRLHALPEAAQRLLQAASLSGDEFTLALAASATALDEWEAVQALEAALAARMLARDAADSRRYRFEHDLFAQAIAAELQPERRALMHRAMARHLVGEGAPPARVAAHFDAAGDRAQALAWHQRALAQSQRRLALADMLGHAERMLALQPDAAAAMRAQLARAAAMRALARPDEADAAMDAAAAALATAGAEAPLELKVELACARAQQMTSAERIEAALPALDALLADPRLNEGQRFTALTRRAHCLRLLARHDAAQADLQAALQAHGDAPSIELAELLDDLARGAGARGDIAACHAHATRAEEVAAQCDYAAGVAQALTMQGVSLLLQGRFDDARAPLLRSREIASRLGLIAIERGAILNLASVHLARGERREAMQAVDEGHALSRLFASPAEQQAFVEARYQCRVDAGELGAALDARAELVPFSIALQSVPRRHSGLLVSLDLPLFLGDVDLAESALASLRADAQAARRSDLSTQLASKLAWAEMIAGDAAAALRRIEALDLDAIARPEDRLYTEHVRILALLAQGNVGAARAACTLDEPAGSAEVRALHLTAALRAQATEPQGAAPWIERAKRELASGELPALATLGLIDALAALAATAELADQARTLAHAMHRSLAGHPGAQQRFAIRFARWLGR